LSGIVGDNFDQRRVLTWAYIGLGTVFFMLGLPGFMDMSSGFWYYYFILNMFLIGAINALLWPSFISIIGHWFPKSSRGFLAGLWSTCNNTGNIFGMQIGAALLNIYGEWQYLLVTISFIVFIWAGVIYFFLVPEPDLIGINI
jgi:MFS transporter, OPA family, solute carrier family 37 (glycerol-3-phosphate transporter), member 3